MKRCHRKTHREPGIFRPGQSGQVLIEYVLMLVILVAMAISFLNLFAKPFQTYTTDLMGSYTSCLLETGELPTLNNTEVTECTMPKLSDGNGSSASNSGPGSAAEKAARDAKNAAANDSSSGGSGGSNGGSGGASGSGGSRGNFGHSRSSHGPGSADGAGSSKVTEIPAAGSNGEGGGFFKGSANGYAAFSTSRRKSKSIGLETLSESDRKKIEKKEVSSSRTIAASEGLATKAKKFDVKPPSAKVKIDVDDDQASFHLGDWIRYLFIGAVIIIIISLIGGQVAQMMKSWEK